ncbi:hypothetical protein YPPY46_2344, partial [Yersinia pestis PY-46]
MPSRSVSVALAGVGF